ncbi:hypothetical protein Scep_016049 [Stephania cephalantha]|uniref:Knottins-like domain-containing protein n=1 Tax=Stephania cephalantha TaxID=152367 RepID=A0AAP0NVF2_9MAGN
MAMNKKTTVLAFLLVCLVLLGSEMKVMREVEGRTCESASHKFKGPCGRDSNCASICQTEHFTDGHCHGFRRRCICSKPC